MIRSGCHAISAKRMSLSRAGDSTPSGPIDLAALDDYLMSDHAPDDCMGLSDLDGFLTGVVVGPELIPFERMAAR